MNAKHFKLTVESKTLLQRIHDDIAMQFEDMMVVLGRIEGTTERVEETAERTDGKIDEILNSQQEVMKAMRGLKNSGSDSKKPIIVLVTVTDEETNGLHHAFMGDEKVTEIKSGRFSYFDLSGHGEYQIFHIVSKMDDGAAQNPVGEAIDHWKPKACIAVGIAFGSDSEDQKVEQVLVATEVVKYADAKIIVTCSLKLIERVQTTNAVQKEAASSGWPKVRFGRVVSNNTRVEDKDMKRKFPEVIGFETGSTVFFDCTQKSNIDLMMIKGIYGFLDDGEDMPEKKQQLAAEKACHVLKVALNAGCCLYDSLEGKEAHDGSRQVETLIQSYGGDAVINKDVSGGVMVNKDVRGVVAHTMGSVTYNGK